MKNEDITIQLIKDIKEGDRFAFDKLVSLYEKDVYRICHRFFNNEEDIDRVFQDDIKKLCKQ